VVKKFSKDNDGLFTEVGELREIAHTAVGLLYDLLNSPSITGIPMRLVIPPDAYALLDAFILEIHAGTCPHITKKDVSREHVTLSPELEAQLRTLLDNL